METKGKKNEQAGKQSDQQATDKNTAQYHELFVDGLKDIYWAEKELLKNLPKMVKGATSQELKKAFEDHKTQTETHVQRLEKSFESIGEKAKAVKCEAMAGLLKEAAELMEETEAGTPVRDAALIAAAQKVEHYEIATYGTLATMAGHMGHKQAQKELHNTLNEEKKTDSLLSTIAEKMVFAKM